jgi:hypothetical protein
VLLLTAFFFTTCSKINNNPTLLLCSHLQRNKVYHSLVYMAPTRSGPYRDPMKIDEVLIAYDKAYTSDDEPKFPLKLEARLNRPLKPVKSSPTPEKKTALDPTSKPEPSPTRETKAKKEVKPEQHKREPVKKIKEQPDRKYSPDWVENKEQHKEETKEQSDGKYSPDWVDNEEQQKEEYEDQEGQQGEEWEEALKKQEDYDVGKAGKMDTESSPSPKITHRLPIQPKRMIKEQQPTPTKFTAPESSSSKASLTPAPQASSKKRKKRKQPSSSLLRVAWNDTMCEMLLTELVNLVRKGSVSDKGGFREAIWEGVAEKIRPYYSGNAPFHGRKCKSKYEGYKGVWSAWCVHLDHISGWTTRDSDGLPVAEKEIMDEHFQEFPLCEQFRDDVPAHFDYVSEIFGRLATGENDHGPDSMGEEEVESSEGEQEGEPIDDKTILRSVEKEPSSTPARSSTSAEDTASRSLPASTASLPNPRATPKITGKRIAERKLTIGREGPSKRRRTRPAGEEPPLTSDADASETVENSEAVLRTILREALDKLLAPNTSSTATAIEVFRRELKDDFSTGNDAFKVYRLLRQPQMAENFLVLEDTERADWLRFELGSIDG